MVHYSGSIEYSRRWDRRVYPVPRCHKVVSLFSLMENRDDLRAVIVVIVVVSIGFFLPRIHCFIWIFSNHRPQWWTVQEKKKRKKEIRLLLFSRSVYMCISYLEKCTGYEIEFSRSKCQESIRSDEWIYKTGDWLACRNVQVLKSRRFIDVSYEDKERTMCGQKSADKTGSK